MSPVAWAARPCAERHHAVGPGLALERLGAFGAVLEVRQHLGDGAALAGARQPVEIVDVVEGGELLVQARLEIDREIGPAGADIDAAQFEPRQQRDGIGLVLAELLPHAPHALVVQRQRLVGAVEVDQEQREVPPVVRLHEGVAVAPGVGHRVEEGDALQHPAARFEAMGDGVMRPRIVAVERQPLARGGLGLVEAIALFEAERIHAPDEAVVLRWPATSFSPISSSVSASPRLKARSCASLPAKRSRGHSATILAELLQAAGRCRPRPRPRWRRATRVRAALAPAVIFCARVEVARRRRLAFGRIHGEDEARRDQRQHRALFFLVGGGDEVGEAACRSPAIPA